MRLELILTWLKEPGSIKFLITLAGAAGFAIDPTKLTEILAGVYAINSLVNGFYDRNPRKPSTE